MTSVTLFPPVSVKRVLSIQSLTVGFVVVTVYEQIKIICQMSQGFFFSFESYILLSDISPKYKQMKNPVSKSREDSLITSNIHTYCTHGHTHTHTV